MKIVIQGDDGQELQGVTIGGAIGLEAGSTPRGVRITYETQLVVGQMLHQAGVLPGEKEVRPRENVRAFPGKA